MELSTKRKGNLTELQCMTAFMALNYSIAIPYGDGDKYDFIADINGKLIKVQVKTSSLVKNDENAIQFSCRSTHLNCKGTTNVRYTDEDIDYFATYWNYKCYLIPVSECSTNKTLRFIPPSNNRVKGISLASDYELEKQLKNLNKEESN